MTTCLLTPPALAAPGADHPPAAPARNPIEDGLYRNVWRHARGARLALVGSMLLLVASQLVKLAVPWCAAQAVDALQHGGPDMLARALAWIGAVLAACIASWALHGPGRVLERRVGMRVRESLSDTLYGRLAAAPLDWHERHHSSDLQQRVRQSSGALVDFAQNQYVYLQSVVNFIGPVVALMLLSVPLGACALAGHALLALVGTRFDRALMRLATKEMAADRRYNAGLNDFLGHAGAVTSLRLQQATRRLLAQRLGAIFQPLNRSIVLNELKWCAVDLGSTVLTWSLVIGYVVFALHGGAAAGGLALGAIFMVHQYASQTAAVASAMAGQFQGLAHKRADFASAATIMEAPSAAAPAALPRDWQRIVVRDLAWRPAAAPAGAPTLAIDTLALERGERIAIVGGSGAGKSTLMRVLAGLYAADRARIEVDGAAHPGASSLGALATLVPQEADVFEGTVRENLDFGTGIDAALLGHALHGSAFDAVLPTLAGGLDAAVAQRGSNFSGGQRQRLCLARGALAARTSSLVFLDEPTSALDPLTEARVHERLAATFPDACIVASVHRMSLLAHFDRVVLMDGGRIVDTGSVDALRRRQPTFAAMLAGAAAKDRPARAAGAEAPADGAADADADDCAVARFA
jgi:ABC-type multidrug transport system fused ATPase/permease subunit